MNKASGVVVAVGIVAAAAGYVGRAPFRSGTSDPQSLAPTAVVTDSEGLRNLNAAAPNADRLAGDRAFTALRSDSSIPEPSGAASGDFALVTVYFATDRAVEGLHRASWHYRPWAIGGACGLGGAVLAGWLALLGRRRWAWGMGAASMVLAVGLSVFGSVHSRQVAGIHRPDRGGPRYGRERGTLQVGRCEVSVPHSHVVGQLERPSLLRLEVRARPDRHVMLQRVLPQVEADFYADLRRRVASSPRRDMFVFVHGYNVTFELAARRTAQMAYDLRFQGAPVFYSWPSQGEPWNYAIDENNVAWTVPHLKKFLVDLASHTDAQAINLVAHSMGNRALTQAVRELAYEMRDQGRLFHQVILAAPDIDADVFQRDIAPAITQMASQITLYASAHDDALAASKLVHGYRRAGDVDGGPVIAKGINTVDVSTVDMSLLGHSYYGSSEWILRDLAALLLEARSVSERPWLRPMGHGEAQYWRYETSAGHVTQRESPLQFN